VRINISIGVACFPRDGRTAEKLPDRADMATYAAKAAGRIARNLPSLRASTG
jgi:predicted signal transduction protein with EAL and GGDEF domain